ncbi:DNA polymerase iota isoform X2 [Clupea harengus]|uniref:DNA polymerase iota isoform X2 n=1 Tax=Clupea harengus TaxID=7950 RepID=A0A6P8FS34_CLUHA|nr:DNA polymerase iota isoform X2 [Clupea harengus]
MDIDDEDDDWNIGTDMLVMGSSDTPVSEASSSRVILHFDLDCFYAQVEMIRNPALRNKPLGIQQKYIIVTCNYVARDLGLTKLMSVTDALEKCPQLVLVKGEDLTHYREMSYKVTELLMSYYPLVQRLGFDENFLDVTEMVDTKVKQAPSTDLTFSGHIYNEESLAVYASDYPRLAIGSHIAAELREAIKSNLGLTSCAGVATNKLLAKLVSGTFKPNQQTILLPESTADIMGSLSGLRKVPGIGHRTGERLKALGLITVRDLQCIPPAELAREFGAASAQHLQNLAQGIDNSPITPAGPPQSLSDEDSFKKMSLTTEVLKKIEDLLISLMERMFKDGRQPSTFRLTIRRFLATNRYFSRESRQCPIPNHIGQKITTGSCDALAQLVNIAMKLFHKMIDTNSPFHLTLINVCFSNLQSKSDGRGSITSFFTQRSPKKVLSVSQQQNSTLENLSVKGSSSSLPGDCTAFANDSSGKRDSQSTSSKPSEQKKPPPLRHIGTPLSVKSPVPEWTQVPVNSNEHHRPSPSQDPEFLHLPPDVDPDVFKHLPESIQKELLSGFYAGEHEDRQGTSSQSAAVISFHQKLTDQTEPPLQQSSMPTDSIGSGNGSECVKQTTEQTFFFAHRERLSTCTEQEEGNNRSPDTDYPSNVDPTVFSELPPELQRELLSEWRQQKPVLKIPSKKVGKTASTKDKKVATKAGQANNLLNYFKPD